jgi:protein-tyrosine-phosphatase
VLDVGVKYDYIPRADIVLAMKEKGIDISSQRIKKVTKKMFEEAEKVVVLCDPKLLPAYIKLDDSRVILRQVQDPVKSSMKDIRVIRDRVEKIVTSLFGLV